ncbi:fibronectin type III domain-containing protein [bacterium]|nr:MAG: fibronectin type III domain-containing protein [bacterium]
MIRSAAAAIPALAPSGAIPPQITGVSAHLLSADPTKIRLEWLTDKPTSTYVQYGVTPAMGFQQRMSTLSTSHSLNLSNLEPSTNYYYRIVSTDNRGNSSAYGGGRFSTAPPTIVRSNKCTTSSVKYHSDNVVKPEIVLATDLSKYFKSAPSITGRATDNVAIARVEYSLNGGLDWQAVPGVLSGSPTTNFSFTPVLSSDGNYPLLVRAIDTSGNLSVTAGGTVVIDRLAPSVGVAVLTQGHQSLTPSINGQYQVSAGLDYDIALSAVGGPTSITIDVVAGSTVVTAIGLAPDKAGLWRGV